jgi:putative ABC transport system permease protein
MNDLRHAMRLLRKSPVFTAVALVMLTLGIGANTAVFSLMDAWLIRPLSFKNPERLVVIFGSDRKRPAEPLVFEGYRILLAWKERSRSFDDLGGLFWRSYVMIGNGEPEQFRGMLATADFFRVLGVEPVLGRTFSPGDRAGPPVAVLSHSLWTRRFGAAPDVVGKQVTLNSVPHTVIGVMPAEFDPRILNQPRLEGVWTLLRPGEPNYGTADLGPIAVIGRLKPGITPAQAQAELESIQDETESQHAENMKKFGVLVTPIQADNTRTVRATLLTLAGAVGFVLLIACTSVATLLMGRASSRARELAVRAALGAGRARLVCQMLTESLLLCALGGAGGVGLAHAAVHGFRAANPLGELPANSVSVDVRALAFTVALTLLTTVLFGLAPALHGSRVDLISTLKSAGSSSATGRRRAQSLLLAGQIAMTVVILTGAALMIETLWKLRSTPLGFRAESVSALEIALSPAEYNTVEERIRLYERVAAEIRAVAGVRGVTFSNAPPLHSAGSASITVEDESRPAVDAEQRSGLEIVAPDYFAVRSIPILRGRSFTDFDHESAQPVVVLNQLAARALFQERDPVGRRIKLNKEPAWRKVIGVSGDVRSAPFYNRIEWDNNPRVYLPHRQGTEASGSPVGRSMYFYLRAETAPRLEGLKNLLAGFRTAIASYQPLNATIAEATRQPRFRAELLAGFGVMTLLLAAIGIYGVTSQAALARVREIGIRTALGAEQRQILWMVVSRSLALAGTGAVFGTMLAVALAQVLRSMLYGVSPIHPPSLALAAGLLVAVSAFAAYLPARKASLVDPVVVLRQD